MPLVSYICDFCHTSHSTVIPTKVKTNIVTAPSPAPRLPLPGSPFAMSDGPLAGEVCIRTQRVWDPCSEHDIDLNGGSIFGVRLSNGHSMVVEPVRFHSILLLRPVGHEVNFEVMS